MQGNCLGAPACAGQVVAQTPRACRPVPVNRSQLCAALCDVCWSAQVVISLKLDADLRSAFSWNTKQLFVYVQAEYVTPENKVNQVVLWDRIVQRQQDAHLKVKSLRLKYQFVDRGNNLRGLPYNITVAWDVMPKVGRLFIRSKSFPMEPLPAEYSA